MPISIIKQENNLLLLPEINQQFSKMLKSDWFDINFWQHQDAVTGQSRGRNITWFVGHQDDEWVLRHYYRGGMVAKLLGDKYLFSDIKNTRCYRELLLLEQMFLQGLPVPKPIAARVTTQNIFYRADLLIEKIPHAEDLVQKLTKENIAEAIWHSIGSMIAKFHEAGIFHSDLNAHNILLDNNNKVWLIDFDKCEQRTVAYSWQQANLQRLQRSLVKEKGLHRNFAFDDQCWRWLIGGYEYFYQLSSDGNQ
ncbi:3-deoxy-D-manno-octulosonic acid kinase [Aliikangiella coralliicola]|uniref:3-deoxy-D-manno-octulosonic acid kinase n=1 Tax=Aliikangiella coralliicola TaxID=2592383 RepID=A0A545TW27_9GAMM|nr:3-deoxy-D-manno-octulosonic acid kinase [Aliikangiella coralliicola]TQV81423.1 3-deoxy-D-manno-octulosonic acid kinase [Aliikangiella coralliicola]